MSELRTLIKERYYILEEIGRGGLTTVFKAFDFQERCDIALKILAPHLVRDPTFKVRFEREINILKQFDHPNIVPILDSGEHQGVPFLVMPFFREGTLTDRLRSEPLSPEECGRLISEISSALDYEHKRGIVHLDIKPSNILLDHDGKAYLSDFDLVYLPDTSQNLTGSAVIGTPAYMSPEQCSSGPVDARSDQYSLAIVLFQLTTGHLPFYAETPIALAIQQINEPLPRPKALNPNLPESIQNVLQKALSKDPKDRYPSILSFNYAVQRALRIAKLSEKEDRSWTAKYYEITQGFDRIQSSARAWFTRSKISKGNALLAGLLVFLVFPLIAANLINSGGTRSQAALEATIAAIYTQVAPQEGTAQPQGYIETVVAGTVSALEIQGTAASKPILITGGDKGDGTRIHGDQEIANLETIVVQHLTSSPTVSVPTSTFTNSPPPTATATRTARPTHTPRPSQLATPVFTSVHSPTPDILLTQTAEAFRICDDNGKPLAYYDLHTHPVYTRANGIGFVVHVLDTDRQETQVKLSEVSIRQGQNNPEIVSVNYYEWGYWGIGVNRFPVGIEARDVILKTNLDFYDCYSAGSCVHSLYGGDLFVNFDEEMNGDYEVEVELFLPEFNQTCRVGRSIEVTPEPTAE